MQRQDLTDLQRAVSLTEKGSIMVPIEYYQHQKLNGDNNTLKSKWRSSDQELIQSNPTSHPQNQKRKKHIYTQIDTRIPRNAASRLLVLSHKTKINF